MEKVDNMQEHKNNVSREMDILRENIREMHHNRKEECF